MKLIVEGGRPLKGTVVINGAKNAAIKMIAASLLTDEEVNLDNVPAIKDVEIVRCIAQSLGVKIEQPSPNRLKIKADNVETTEIPQPFGLPSRSSVIFMGPLLARFGRVSFPEPGGDHIGKRPINRHISALRALGAEISFENGLYTAKTSRLVGGSYHFDEITVMGTENAILAAVLAEGESVFTNTALEPEIDDLILLLNNMGAEIHREEGRRVRIKGAKQLHGASHEILPDRNELVTYAMAGAVTGGDIILEKVRPADVTAFLAKLEKAGVSFESGKGSLHVWRDQKTPLLPVNIETSPHPGFITDWQQPFSVLLTQAMGVSYVHETVHLSRFGYTVELNRMGAKISLITPTEAGFAVKVSDDGYDLKTMGEPLTVAKIAGPTGLRGKKMQIPDLRAGATIVLAALLAEGKSEIYGVEHIDRGYENFDLKLKSLGAVIERVE